MDPVAFHRELMRLLKIADETGRVRLMSEAAGLVERAVEEWSGERFIVNVTIALKGVRDVDRL